MTTQVGESSRSFLAPDEANTENFVNKLGEPRQVARYFTVIDGPYGYLVTTPRNDMIKPHFHRVDQFQLFYGARGASYKGVAIEPGHALVHYADAFSTYGPIHTGAEPLDYFTLRACYDVVTAYMPADRDKLRQTPRHRNIYHDLILDPPAGPDRLEVVLEPREDGLAVYRIHASAGQPVSVPDVKGTAGQYCCVLNGGLLQRDRFYGPRSLGWLGRDQPSPELTAEAEGVDLLILRFPYPTVRLDD